MRKRLSIPMTCTGPSRIAGLTRIRLSGSNSLFAKAFNWSLVSKPMNSYAMLNRTNIKDPTLIADIIGDYIIELVVKHDTGDSAPTQITITVSNEDMMQPVSGTASIH